MFSNDLSNIEKAYLIAHMYDYVPSIRQNIVINKDKWLKELRKTDDYKFTELYAINTVPKSLEKCAADSISKLRSFQVGTDLFTFIMKMNRECNDVYNQYKINGNKDSLLSYLEYVLFNILPRKVTAVECARKLGTNSFQVDNFSYVTNFIDRIKNGIDKLIVDIVRSEEYVTDIAKALYLFHKLQIYAPDEISFDRTCSAFLMYIQELCGITWKERVLSKVKEFTTGQYIPVGNSGIGSCGISKICGPMKENYHNDVVSISGRRFNMFGTLARRPGQMKVYGINALNISENDVYKYIHEGEINFDLSPNDLMDLNHSRENYGLIKVRAINENVRYVFTRRDDPKTYVLFTCSEKPNDIFGVSCDERLHGDMDFIRLEKTNSQYELGIGGEILDH